MKIKITFLLILATCIFFTSCRKIKFVKEKPKFEIEYGLQPGLYQDPELLIDGLSIAKKNDLYYLFNQQVEYSQVGYNELRSVDYELIKIGITIKKNMLTKKYIGINNGYVTIIGMDKEYKIQEQINKFVGCTLDGFIIENKDNKFDYYDYEGKLIGGKYNSVQLKDYYRNIKIQEGVYSLIYFNLNNSKDLYISGKKIENVSEYIDYPKANVLVLKINNKYKVYKYDGSITHNIVFDELSDINKDYPFLYYKDTKTMYYYKSPDQIINLGVFEGLNKINIIDIGNNYLSYLESNNVLVAFTDLGIGIYHDIEYAKSINCKYFLVEKNDKLMIVNLYEYFSYEFKGGYSEQIIEIDGHMCAVYNDTVNNNYVVIYKDAAKVYTNGNENYILHLTKDGKLVYFNINNSNEFCVININSDITNLSNYSLIILDNNQSLDYKASYIENKYGNIRTINLLNTITYDFDLLVNIPEDYNNYSIYNVEEVTGYFLSFYPNSMEYKKKLFSITFKNNKNSTDQRKLLIEFLLDSEFYRLYEFALIRNNKLISISQDSIKYYEFTSDLKFVIKQILDYKFEETIKINNNVYYKISNNNGLYGLIDEDLNIIIHPIYKNFIYLDNYMLKDLDGRLISLKTNKELKVNKNHLNYNVYYYTNLEITGTYLYDGNLKLIGKFIESEISQSSAILYDENESKYVIRNLDKFYVNKYTCYLGIKKE